VVVQHYLHPYGNFILETGVTVFYKIISHDEWQRACKIGVFSGSAVDLKDGYIHLSAIDQVKETARLHFAGQAELVLVAIAESVVAQHLKWEPSRSGQLFPHVYAVLDPAQILWVKPLPWNGSAHDFPKGLAV
jgi:uncharacterized protein (DUF952 family)